MTESEIVMAGLVPAIHVFGAAKQDVDAWHKAGHDRCIQYKYNFVIDIVLSLL
jgi:hypothetical protein